MKRAIFPIFRPFPPSPAGLGFVYKILTARSAKTVDKGVSHVYNK